MNHTSCGQSQLPAALARCRDPCKPRPSPARVFRGHPTRGSRTTATPTGDLAGRHESSEPRSAATHPAQLSRGATTPAGHAHPPCISRVAPQRQLRRLHLLRRHVTTVDTRFPSRESVVRAHLEQKGWGGGVQDLLRGTEKSLRGGTVFGWAGENGQLGREV